MDKQVPAVWLYDKLGIHVVRSSEKSVPEFYEIAFREISASIEINSGIHQFRIGLEREDILKLKAAIEKILEEEENKT
jgi:hypothetical protein